MYVYMERNCNKRREKIFESVGFNTYAKVSPAIYRL